MYMRERVFLDDCNEKLAKFGVSALSDLELMEMIIAENTSWKKFNHQELFDILISEFDRFDEDSIMERLALLPWLSENNKNRLVACFEFVRRRIQPKYQKIKDVSDVLPFLKHYADRKQEHLIVLSLNGANELIKFHCVSVGLVDSTLIHPREVFVCAIEDRASSIILAHNHPHGNIAPSRQDLDVTKKIKSAGNLLKIKLLDHIIFTTNDYFSFCKSGMM